MPLIYKPYQATLANKEGQKLYYPRLVKFGKMVNTQKMAELIAEKASLTAGDVHNVIRNLMSVAQQPHGAPRRLGNIYNDCQSRRKRSGVGE